MIKGDIQSIVAVEFKELKNWEILAQISMT